MSSARGQTQGGGSSEAGWLIPLGGAILGTHRHICAFFNSHDDQYRVLLPFIKDGFECGEKAVQIIDPQPFDQRRTLELIDDIRERSKQQGFRRIRFVTHMEWALEDRPGVDGLLEYEASANLVPFEDPVICAYDLARFGAEVVVEAMGIRIVNCRDYVRSWIAAEKAGS